MSTFRNCIFICLLFSVNTSAQPLEFPCLAVEQVQNKSYERFLTTACTATEKYQDVRAAISAGYRRIGPDTPHMGQHWINIKLAQRTKINIQTPAVLTYLPVGDSLYLTGVAYLAAYTDSNVPAPPFESIQWHFHSESITEELVRADENHQHRSPPDAGVAMFHAWIWSSNPDGIFASDHWGLSYLREGLPIPTRPEQSAAKALYLRHGGVTYFTDLFETILGTKRTSSIEEVLKEKQREVNEHVRNTQDAATLNEDLTKIWLSTQDEIASHLTEQERHLHRSMFSPH